VLKRYLRKAESDRTLKAYPVTAKVKRVAAKANEPQLLTDGYARFRPRDEPDP
jgi:hypothetical protein